MLKNQTISVTDNLCERNLSCQNKIQKEYSNKIKQNNKMLSFNVSPKSN